MDIKNKKTAAIDFMNRVQDVDEETLNDFIVAEVGEEMAEYFLEYSTKLITSDPFRLIENATLLLLMGYLLRTNEEKGGLALIKAKTKAKKKKKATA